MPMTKEHKNVLTKFRVQLVEEITLDHALWDHLRTRHVVTASVQQKITHNKPEKEQIGLLLDHLPRRPDESFAGFCESLIETDQAHIVSDYLRNQDESESSNKRALSDSDEDASAKKICTNDLDPMEDDDLDLTDGPIEVRIMPSERAFFQKHKQQAYQMNRSCRGHALIVNVQTVVGQTPRTGTDVDRDKLEKLWVGLHFQTMILNDEDGLGAEEIMEKVEYFLKMVPFGSQACVICLLSHGTEDRIYGSDGNTFLVNDVAALLQEKNAPKLAGKPKILVLQACRGRIEDHGTIVYDESDSAKLHPSGSDLIVCYPTVHGYMSWRNTQRGSWFIAALVQVFMKHAHDHDLLKLLTRVNAAVSLRESTSGRKKQAPEFCSRLQKDLYFFPGVCE